MAKNIEMNYKQGESEYEVLYPNVKVESVIDIEEHYYTKNEINGQISDIIPNPYGVLAIKATDDEGNPVSVQLTVNPQINSSSIITTDSDSGLFVAFVNPETYNLTAPAGSDFIQYNIDIPNAQVKTNQVTNVNVSVNVVQSGEIEITSSRTIQFPANFNIPVDIWGCGGGGGGSVAGELKYSTSYEYGCGASGAAGGYTTLVKSYNVSGKSLNVTIGSKGNGGIFSSVSNPGGRGGATKILFGQENIFNAEGGEGGYSVSNINGTAVLKGGNGGSGGGSCGDKVATTSSYTQACSNGGQDGSDGGIVYKDLNPIYSTGQGTTTRKFGQSTGDLLCSGGGAAFCSYYYQGDRRTQLLGTSGSGAGSPKYSLLFSHPEGSTFDLYGNDATSYGSAGGSVAAIGNRESGPVHIVGGSGMQGVVYIRWPSQST